MEELHVENAIRGHYDPFDPRNYNSGGFGAGDRYQQNLDDDDRDEEPEMHWTDAFPHDFHGWGPLTPDYDNDQNKLAKVEDKRDRRNRFRTQLRYDDLYLTWSAEHPDRRKPQATTH